ncbi:MAG: VanW family protein [Patescibacteria group bacterium]|nr:VanW family protein [Patescibacteria group bacterium]
MVSKSARKILVIVCFSSLILFLNLSLMAFFLIFYQFAQEHQEKIFPQVLIDGIDFSGKTKKEVENFFKEKLTQLERVNLVLTLENKEVASFSAMQLGLGYNVEIVWKNAYKVGRRSSNIASFSDRLLSFLGLKKIMIESNLIFDDDLIRNHLFRLKQEYDKPAKNALFEFTNNRVTTFRKEEEGREIEVEELLSQVKKEINSLKFKAEDKIFYIKPKIIKPEITLAQANQFGIEELLGSGQSNFSGSPPNRIHNIKLASSKFHGVLIPPERVFSFNETLGEVSHLTGYQPAYIIKDGKTILGDGGGVCQVSTTLFRAALNAGLDIKERVPHAYRVTYYESDLGPGFDATVYQPEVDLKIKNNTLAYVLIQTTIDETTNLLTFTLYGKKDNRQVEITKPQIWDLIPPPAPRYQEDPTLKKGMIRQVEFPAWGGKVSFRYRVHQNNRLIIDKEFFSSYLPWQAVFLIGNSE